MNEEQNKAINIIFDKLSKLSPEEFKKQVEEHKDGEISKILRESGFKFSENLLHCPFCGSDAEIIILKESRQFFPRCTCNIIEGYCLMGRYPVDGEDGFKFKQDAIDMWNRRSN